MAPAHGRLPNRVTLLAIAAAAATAAVSLTTLNRLKNIAIAAVQRIAGNHNMAATRMHNVMAVAAKQAEADLRESGVLSLETGTSLGLFDVGRVICNTAIANDCPDSAGNTVNDAVLGRFIPVAAMPAVFSQQLVAMPPPPGLDKPMLWPEDFHSAKDA